MITWKSVARLTTVLLLGAALVRCTGSGFDSASGGASDLKISGTLGATGLPLV